MIELERISHGLWRPSGTVDDLAARCAALLQVLPPDAVIAGPAAARLHGLWLPDLPDEPIEVIVHDEPDLPRAMGHSRRQEVRVRRRSLHMSEIVMCHDLPVTSAARTWCDLAEVLSSPDLVAVGDSVMRGGVTDEELATVISRGGHRRGIVRARAVWPWLNSRSRSRAESHLRYALVSNGLPTPEVNVAIHTENGEWLAEPDLHYPRARLALEYNGADHAQPRRMRRDITRDLDYQRAGCG